MRAIQTQNKQIKLIQKTKKQTLTMQTIHKHLTCKRQRDRVGQAINITSKPQHAFASQPTKHPTTEPGRLHRRPNHKTPHQEPQRSHLSGRTKNPTSEAAHHHFPCWGGVGSGVMKESNGVKSNLKSKKQRDRGVGQYLCTFFFPTKPHKFRV